MQPQRRLYGCPCHASALVPQTTQELDGSLSGLEYSDDSDVAYMKKGEKLCYSYAATVLIDAGGLIEQVALSAANASEQKGFVAKVAEHVSTGKTNLWHTQASLQQS